MREKQLAQEARKLDAKVGVTKSWSGGQDKKTEASGNREPERTWKTKTHPFPWNA